MFNKRINKNINKISKKINKINKLINKFNNEFNDDNIDKLLKKYDYWAHDLDFIRGIMPYVENWIEEDKDSH